MATDAGIRAADAFGLLSYYGSDSAGSLTPLPPGTSTAPGRTVALSDSELSARIRALPQHSLAACAQKFLSLAGPPHKLAVILMVRPLCRPGGSEPAPPIPYPHHPAPTHTHNPLNTSI